MVTWNDLVNSTLDDVSSLSATARIPGVDGAADISITYEDLLGVALTALFGLTPAANRVPYFDGTTTAAIATFTAAARTLLDDSDVATMRRTLGTISNLDGVCRTIDARNISSTPTWPAANRCQYVRMTGARTTTSALEIYVGTSSGNVSVGLFTDNGSHGTSAQPTGARKATSGAVACPTGASFASVALTGSVAVVDGDFAAISCDNTTATFGRNAAMVASGAGVSYFENTAHPVPATVGALTASTHAFYVAAYS
jgi:HAMP domain-containing protein